jgi:hypothetical protein
MFAKPVSFSLRQLPFLEWATANPCAFSIRHAQTEEFVCDIAREGLPHGISFSLQYVRWLARTGGVSSERYELEARDENNHLRYENIVCAETMIKLFGSWRNVMRTAQVESSFVDERVLHTPQECVEAYTQAIRGTRDWAMAPRQYHEYWKSHQELPNIWELQANFPYEQWNELSRLSEEILPTPFSLYSNLYQLQLSELTMQQLTAKLQYCQAQIDFLQSGIDQEEIEEEYLPAAQSSLQYKEQIRSSLLAEIQLRTRTASLALRASSSETVNADNQRSSVTSAS